MTALREKRGKNVSGVIEADMAMRTRQTARCAASRIRRKPAARPPVAHAF
ncbi:hypothetical protein [Burkholderia sp.]|nr:hypothetical protein [Burkholderia sp.]MBS6359495.1 hypothetical protein [Burkholderia sp.]